MWSDFSLSQFYLSGKGSLNAGRPERATNLLNKSTDRLFGPKLKSVSRWPTGQVHTRDTAVSLHRTQTRGHTANCQLEIDEFSSFTQISIFILCIIRMFFVRSQSERVPYTAPCQISVIWMVDGNECIAEARNVLCPVTQSCNVVTAGRVRQTHRKCRLHHIRFRF